MALDQFLSAVRASDLELMGQLWGTERGPAAEWLDDDELIRRVATMQVYLAHRSYRVLGPAPVTTAPASRQAFQVELTRPTGCTALVPIELVRTQEQRWLVVDVNLDEIDNPARPCNPS